MRRNFLFVLFFLKSYLCFLPIQGQDEELRLAQAYFQSGDYSKAKAEYEGFLDEGPDLWKKDIIDYNIATSLLAGGNWEEALSRLQMLSDKNIQLPLLKQRLVTNLVVGDLMELNVRSAALKDNPKASLDDYKQMYLLFRRTFLDIDRAAAAWCDLDAIEGSKSCSSSFELQEMGRAVKINFASFLNEYSAYRLAHASIPEMVSALLIGEKSLVSQLAIFRDYTFSEDMKKKYLADYLEQANSWKVMWDKLHQIFKLSSKEIHIENQKTIFEHSQELFFESVHLAEEGNFTKSEDQLKSSQTALSDLLHQIFNDHSVKDVLQQLLISYELALFKDPLQEPYLSQVLETQTSLEGLLKKTVKASDLDIYKNSQKYLKLSVKSFNDFQSVKARIFAIIARFYLKELIEKVDFTPQMKATTVLENAIAKEEFILLLNLLRGQVKGYEKGLIEVDQLMPELQQSILREGDHFLDVVLAQQKELFHANSKEKNRCQCHPWDEVIPLFSEGYNKAELASRFLRAGNFKQNAIERLQKSTVDYWKEALAKMHTSFNQSEQQSPEKQPEQRSPQNQSEQQSSKENSSSNKQQPEKEKFNEVLRLVQDMENDDKSKPLLKGSSETSEGNQRPW